MYVYLKCMYDQWCCGQSESNVKKRSEIFIDMAHHHIGYKKEDARTFLYKQKWFKYESVDNVDSKELL